MLFSSPEENSTLFLILDGNLIHFDKIQDHCIYALISSEDRLDDYTPFPHPALNPRFNDFGGKGLEFLDFVKNDILNALEKDFLFDKENVVYGGISLGGLHAIYSSVNNAPFKHYFSLVGSFWYPGFVEYMKEQKIPQDVTYTLVNGKKEGNNHSGLLLSLAPQKAEELFSLLKEKNGQVDAYFDEYGHHDKVTERFLEVERRILSHQS